jgi:very-short-patch-repair endonuclease
VLLGGDRARVGGEAAGHLYGLIPDPPLPVVIMIPHDARIRRQYPWAFVREREGTRDVGSRGSPPRLSPEDTVLDLCHHGRADDVVGWVTTAVQRRLTTPKRLALAVGRRSRQRHRALILELIADVAEGAQSPLEIRYLRDVERPHGLPKGRRQARSRDGRSVRDVDYEELKVIVELDGRAGHTELGRFKDMWRDNISATEGWQTLRYGAFDLTHRPCEVAQQVGYVLRLNGWTGSPTHCARCRLAS